MDADKPLAGAIRAAQAIFGGECACEMCRSYVEIIARESWLAEFVEAVKAAKICPTSSEAVLISEDDWQRIVTATQRVKGES